jgi:hypothetical protein
MLWTDWEKLALAVESVPELAGSALNARLKERLERIRALRTLQAYLSAERQVTTQELNGEIVETKDLALQLRAELKGKIGVRDLSLEKFNVRPLGKTRRRSKRPPAEPEETEVAPGSPLV